MFDIVWHLRSSYAVRVATWEWVSAEASRDPLQCWIAQGNNSGTAKSMGKIGKVVRTSESHHCCPYALLCAVKTLRNGILSFYCVVSFGTINLLWTAVELTIISALSGKPSIIHSEHCGIYYQTFRRRKYIWQILGWCSALHIDLMYLDVGRTL